MTDIPKLSATEKTLAVLAAAIADGRLSHICQSTGQPGSTVHRILNEMVRAGWLTQGDDRIYRPGPQAFMLVAKLGEASQIGAVAKPILQELSSQTGLTVHLGVLRGSVVEYVAKVDAPKPYRMNSQVGGVVPLYSTAIGKAILAGLPKSEVETLIGGETFDSITAHTLTRGQLMEELPRIRERGWALDDEENEVGLRCIGVRVKGPLQAGLSVTGLTYEVNSDSYAALGKKVENAAAKVSEAIGAKR